MVTSLDLQLFFFVFFNLTSYIITFTYIHFLTRVAVGKMAAPTFRTEGSGVKFQLLSISSRLTVETSTRQRCDEGELLQYTDNICLHGDGTPDSTAYKANQRMQGKLVNQKQLSFRNTGLNVSYTACALNPVDTNLFCF